MSAGSSSSVLVGRPRPRASRGLVLGCTVIGLIIAAAAFRASAADHPISFTGFNRDVVVERAAAGGDTSPYARVWDSVAYYGFYEAGLSNIGVWTYGDGSEGVPQGGNLVSVLDSATVFQLGPYTNNNVLYLSQSSPTGTLALTPPKALLSLSILAASANGGTNGTFVIRFADGSVSESLSYSARDWYDLSGPVALSQCGAIALGNFGAFYTDDPVGYPNLYQTTIDLAARGLHTGEIVSVTFTRPAGPGTSTATTSGIFALSGTPSSETVTNLPPLLVASAIVQGNLTAVTLTWTNVGVPCVLEGCGAVTGGWGTIDTPWVTNAGCIFTTVTNAAPAHFFRLRGG